MLATAVDLFSGAGGATLGLQRAGISVLAAVESDPIAAATYRDNHPDVSLLESDIRDVEPDALRNELGLAPEELTLLKACPPCQGYSTIGAANSSDPRNDLVSEVWRFARVLRPRAVLLENVPGLAKDERLARLIRQLRAVGYRVGRYMVDAVDFGVPQRRRRLIVVALRETPESLPRDLLRLVPRAFTKGSMSTAGEALNLVVGVDPTQDDLHQARPRSPIVMERLASIPPGGSRFDLPESQRLACHKKLPHRNATAAYGRLRPDEPAPTMTTRCTTPSCGQFVHPTEARSLTLREAATIQTFPLDYAFRGGTGQIERQIGNAVPVRMAEGLGHCVLALLKPHTLATNGERTHS